ncbi:putative Ser recombinase [Vibrio phage VPMCC14]|nr:putative Ser recombinase [Vibrio phage VPMCC14]
MTKYVLYRRLSVEDKSRKQHGFDSQMSDIQDFLDKQETYEVVGDFKEYISGAATSKPELSKALELCKQHGATLLIAKLDRLSRKVSQIAILMDSDINLKVALMPNASTFELHIYASLAEQEREMIRDRVRKGLSVVKKESPEKLRKGKGSKWHETFTRNKELGLHNTTKNFQPSENKQKIILAIKQAIGYASPESWTELAPKLNAQGVLTVSSKEWTPSSLGMFCKRNGISLK